MKNILLLLATILTVTLAQGQDLRADISGNAGFDGTQFNVTEAGEDFPSAITSSSTLSLSLRYTSNWAVWFGSNIPWQVLIHKSDLEWNNNLDLQIRRDGSGSKASFFGGNPSIYGGDNYQSVTNNPSLFFYGRYGVLNIPLTLKLTGASLVMGAESFETSIVFTVYENW